MPITFIGSSTGTMSNGSGSISVTVPVGTVEDTVLVVCVTATTPMSVTNFTLETRQGPFASRFLELWTYPVPSSVPASVSMSGGGVYSAAVSLLAFDGVDVAAIVDAISTVINTSASATVVIPSLTTTENGCMLVGTGGAEDVTAWTAPGTMTERTDLFSALSNRVSNTTATELFATAGATGTRTFTPNASTTNAGILVALAPGCVPVHPDPLFIPFKDRLHNLARDFTDEGIARAQEHQFDNWKVVENWAQSFMYDTLSAERCRLQIPYKDHARAEWGDGAEQSFDNWKAVEVWAGYILDGSCGCNCGTTERLGDKCQLHVPAKDALATVTDPLDLETLRLAADMEFDNFKALERWGNLYAAGDCGCTG